MPKSEEKDPTLRHVKLHRWQKRIDTAIRQLAITPNRTRETGAWDDDNLKIEYEELLALQIDLEATGFETPEINFRLGHFSIEESWDDALDDLDALCEDSAPRVSLPGDIWLASEHRVLCGRAQNLANSSILTQMGAAAVLVADPPYNVPISLRKCVL